MINLIKKHVTHDLIFTGLNNIWRSASGAVTIILMPLYLTPEVQGYWFTILGLAALIVFADLGFSTIITQFAAHEFAYLNFDKSGRIVGNEVNLGKLSSFFIFSIKWMACMVVITIPIIFIIGSYIFSQRGTNVNWFLPWTIYLIGTAVTFLNNALLCFIEGCNLVGLAQKIKLYGSLSMFLIMILGLFLGFDLLALSISMLLSALISCLLIYKTFDTLILQLISASKEYTYSWMKEFFPLFWRSAISWASGYFIFQFITPLVFHYHGAVAAGKIGISMALWTAIYNLSHVWVYVVRPNINFYISRREWDQLDRLFKRRLWMSIATYIMGAVAVFLLIFFLRGKFGIIGRFADNITMFFLAAAWFLITITSAITVYLRSHKEEPLVGLIVASSVYIAITTFLCAKYLPQEYLLFGFFSSNILGLPWTLFIFNRKRREWHYACTG